MKKLCLNDFRSKRGRVIVNISQFFSSVGIMTFDYQRSYFAQVEDLKRPYIGLTFISQKSAGTL